MSWLFKSGGPKFWSLSFSLSPSNEYSGLMSFRNDWLDLLAVTGTLRRLLQLHSLQASILRHSGFFMVQFSHPYVTTGKIIALTKQTFNRILTDARSLYQGTNSGRGRWGEAKDTTLLQSWGRTSQGAGKGGLWGAFRPGRLGGCGAVREAEGPRKGPPPGRTVRRSSQDQLAQAGSHSGP